MTEFEINRERGQVFIQEDRPGDGTYHAADFHKIVEDFAARHPVAPDDVELRFWDRCDCGETVAARIHMHAHREETDEEMRVRIEREEYEAEHGMKNALAREKQLRSDRLRILSVIIKELGEETVRKVLGGEKVV